METFPELTVGLPVYNEEKTVVPFISRLVKTVEKNSYKLKEIIVVASGCTDNTLNLLIQAQIEFGLIRVFFEKERRGLTSAYNIIVRNAKGSHILIPSCDNIIGSKSIDLLVDALDSYGRNFAVTGVATPLAENTLIYKVYSPMLIFQYYYQPPKIDFEGMSLFYREDLSELPINTNPTERFVNDMLVKKGISIKRVEEAKSTTKLPGSLKDFLKQRKRNIVHYLTAERKGIKSEEVSASTAIIFLLETKGVKDFMYRMIGILISVHVLILARIDILLKNNHIQVDYIESSKDIYEKVQF